ncbi:MAG: VOC family protein [Gammaproteobacteria bacterium]|nr:VOC family protein [Gammaproteobacteria bacterium]
MIGVCALGYVGLEVSSISAWNEFLEVVLQLPLVNNPGEPARFRLDDHHHRVQLVEGGADDLSYAGFEVRNEKELEAIVERLQSMGIKTGDADPSKRSERRVGNLVCAADPDGLAVELYTAPTRTPVAADIANRFVANEQGLGHIVLMVKDIEASLNFYSGGLGFHLSDIIEPHPAVRVYFLHCNARHHSVALVALPGDKRLNHLMFQLTDIDLVGSAFERSESAGLDISMSLGRHTNDRMFSFYVRTPSGFDLEIGAGARTVVPGTVSVARYLSTSLWGHRPGS